MTTAQRDAAPQLALTGIKDADADRIKTILRAVTDRLDAMNRRAAMNPRTRHVEIQIAVWDHHGDYNTSPVVGRDIVAVLTAVRGIPMTGTRAEYAARLHVALGAVRL
ncbi:hypothetical protein [Streptomyces altiplanensis]